MIEEREEWNVHHTIGSVKDLRLFVNNNNKYYTSINEGLSITYSSILIHTELPTPSFPLSPLNKDNRWNILTLYPKTDQRVKLRLVDRLSGRRSDRYELSKTGCNS